MYKDVIDYYDYCEIDYKMLWDLKKSLSFHLGYWNKDTKNISQALMKINEILADIAKIKKNDKIIDLGCGVGGTSIYLAKKYKANVTGISISNKQIESAKINAKKNNVSHVTNFFTKDYLNTEFKKDSFDVAWVLESMCYTPIKKNFIKEAHRLLKKNGRLIIADAFLSKEKYSKKENNLMKSWLDGWGGNYLIQIEDFKKLLNSEGFSNIKIIDITKNIFLSSLRLFHFGIITYPFGIFLELINVRNKIQHNNMTAAINQHIALKQKLWKYYIIYATKP